MELQQILSKMEADGWEISNDFKIAHGHFLQYFLETVEEALRQPPVSGRSEQLHLCPVCNEKAGKSYLLSKLPTICQKCDHAWNRA